MIETLVTALADVMARVNPPSMEASFDEQTLAHGS